MIFLGLTPKRYAPLGGAANDADAQAFITAAGITNATQQSAVNQLVLDLKSANIWTKMKAIYPIVGGTASTHKWNLKDPRDLDAAFRLNFSLGWTHSSNGMTPSNAYADTFLIPSTSLSLNSQHISYYSRTNSNGTEVEMGCNNSGGAPNTILEIRTTGVTYMSMAGNAYLSYTDSNSFGMYIGNRTASNIIKLHKNNSVVATGTTASTSNPINQLSIGALNTGGGRLYYTTKQCAFASIGDGLTDTEAANFYTSINTYQTTLGRNV